MLVAYEGKAYEVQAEHPPEFVDSLLGLLSKTPPISPGLQSIHIHPAIATDTTATAAGHALRHHASSLVSLTMTPPAADDAAPAAVLRTLPHLTLLTNLHLTFPTADPCPRYGIATADSVRLLTAAIPALPALARFYLFDLRTATCIQLPKRGGQRLRVPAGRPTLQTLADALCDAPALTSLTLGHATPKNAVPLPCRALRAPLPALCELRLVAFRACIGAVTNGAIPDRHISVPPLPALTSFAYIGSREPLTCSDVAATTACVAQHKQLRSLELTFWHLPTGGERIVAEALRSLPQLDVIDLVFGPSHVHSVRSMHSIMSAVAYHTGLTRLECLIECLPKLGEAGPADGGEPMPMPDMLTPLTGLRGLRALVFGVKTLGFVPRTDEALLVPLSGFTQLTSLVANCGNFSANAPRMAAAWARLPELRRLQFHLLRCPEPGALAACMAPLTAVAELRLAAMPVTAALVRAFAEAATALTALEVAELVSGAIRTNHTGVLVEEYGDPDWIEGLLHLPCRGLFEFNIRNDEITAAEFEGVRRKLVEKGARVAPRCESVSFVPPDA